MEKFSWKSFIAGFASATAVFLIAWNIFDAKSGSDEPIALTSLSDSSSTTSIDSALSFPRLDEPVRDGPHASAGSSSEPLAPVFSSTMPMKFHTDPAGNLRLSWRVTPGAKSYVVALEDMDGKPFKSYSTQNNYYFLKLPRSAAGAYRVKLRGVSSEKIPGPYSESRELVAFSESKAVRTAAAPKPESPTRAPASVPAPVLPPAALSPAVPKPTEAKPAAPMPAARKAPVKLGIPAIKEIKVEE